MQSEHITVLIPTHNRHKYLCRLTDYLFPSGFRLLAIDSSDQAFDGQLPDSTRYLHKPGLPFADKLLLGSELVETDLVAVCADDDFLVPTGVREAASFLAQNESYVSCQGLCMTYMLPNDNLVVVYPKFQNLSLERTRQDFQSSDAKERVLNHFDPFMQWLYAVHRKDAFNAMARLLCGVDPLRAAFVDRVITLGLAAQGNCKVLPSLFMVREHAPETTTKEEKFIALYLNSDKSVQSDINKLRRHLALHWPGSASDGVDENFIETAFVRYCQSLDKTRVPQKPTEGSSEQIKVGGSSFATLVRHVSGEFDWSGRNLDVDRKDINEISKSIMKHFSDDLLANEKFPPDYAFDL